MIDKDKYLKNGYNLCPFCNGNDITGGHVEIDGGSAWQRIGCNDCGKMWDDIYTLTDVEEVAE